MNDDLQNLRLLSIFHYVVAGFAALMGCFPIIHLVIGIALLTGEFPQAPQSDFPQTLFGAFFAGIAGLAILTMWSLAACLVVAGRFLGQQRRRMFCVVVAAVECLLVPFGTVLGVITLIILHKPTVMERFAQSDPISPDVTYGAG
jgi:hypothetical protein